MKQRAGYLDNAKRIGILLVVLEHARGPFSTYIYQFHIPLFFLISGYLFNEKNTVKQFAVKKIKTLYCPFVFWNICFSVISIFLGIKKFSREEFSISIAKIILTIGKDGFFLGATWFLGSLFVVSVSYKVMDAYMLVQKEKSIILLVLYAVIACIGFTITFPDLISRTLILSMFFAAGRVVRKYKEEFETYGQTKVMIFFSAVIFLVIGHYNSANMGANEYRYPLLFVIGALAASYVVIEISKYIENHLLMMDKILSFFGRKSIYILIWQFVVFRLVIAVQLYRNHISLHHLFDYYPCYTTEHGQWILYTVTGMIVPLFIGAVTDFIESIPKKILSRVKR